MTDASTGPEQNADIHERRKADHIRINLEEDVAFKSPVSYTHLDVYKRQDSSYGRGPARRAS